MLGLMETPFHHFFDDRTDAAARDALELCRYHCAGSSMLSAQTSRFRHNPEIGIMPYLMQRRRVIAAGCRKPILRRQANGVRRDAIIGSTTRGVLDFCS
jgi:hypothetical protein